MRLTCILYFEFCAPVVDAYRKVMHPLPLPTENSLRRQRTINDVIACLPAFNAHIKIKHF